MDKLKMHTPNKADENFAKLAALFPNAVTETIDPVTDEVVRAIDKDVLMQEINTTVVDGKDERYQFTWPDKKKAVLAANAPINKTLRPCREESVDFDNTENLYIEGDNLDVLKLLQETYLGKVKMIYIDPPYNTGNDFVYNDDFAENSEKYLERSGQFDEDGNRLFQNTESNGRFHTDWLNMIYPRLKLAKDLLSDDGVIFISIDDNEVENLRKVCDELFGSLNYLGTFIWRKKDGGGQAKEAFVIEHEYILVYQKSNSFIWINKEEIRKESEYKKSDTLGKYKTTKLAKWGNTARREDRPSMYFPIISPDNTEVFPIAPDGGEGRWRIGKQKMDDLINNNLIHWEKKGDDWIPYEKEYFSHQIKTIKERSILYDVANTGDGSNKLTYLFKKKDIFENPKPVELLSRFISNSTTDNDIILDFFSGSGTIAEAVMLFNAEDGGHRKFIMVQVQEKTDEKSEAYKAGYKNICEIGKERIRRAGNKIKEQLHQTGTAYRSAIDTLKKCNFESEENLQVSITETDSESNEFTGYAVVIPENSDDKTQAANKKMSDNLDIGFRVLKLDSTNMKDVYYTPAEFEPSLLDSLSDNIKEDRTPEDLLFQVMLDLGILLSSKIVQSEIAGKKVFNVANSHLIACFDENVTEETITAVAKQKPDYFVMRDSSMASDSVASNFEQIFATYSPNTIRKVL